MDSDGRVVLRPATLDVRQLRGLLHKRGSKPVSVEAMDRAIVAGAMRGCK